MNPVASRCPDFSDRREDQAASAAHLCFSARSASKLIVVPRHIPPPVIVFVVCLALLVSASARAQKKPGPSAADTRLAVPQVHINPTTIALPIVDGTDLRFARPYSAEALSQTKVGQIVQGDQGFMWFGTQYGLDRFDGYNFKVYLHDPGNPNSLSGVFISALFKARDGMLWVGCEQFLNKFDRESETFTRYPVPFVTHISQDTAGLLWLSTRTGLYRLDPVTEQIHRYSHDPNDPSSLSSNDTKSSGEDRVGHFWVVNSAGLDEFDRATGKVTLHIPLPEPSLPFSFYEDSFGVFWIYHVSGNPLAVFDRKTNTLTEYSFHEQKPRDTALTGVTSMLEDQNGTLWLGTNGAGLLKYDREHRRFIRYRYHPSDPDSIAQDSVIALSEDQEGIIWVGLGGLGVSRFASTPLPFRRYRRDFGDSNSTGEPFVGAIYEDSQGILWIGTHEALNRIDRSAQLYSYYTTAGPGEGTDAIAICADRSGNLWVGTYSHGLYRFDRKTGRFKRFQHNPADPYSLSNDIVTRLLVDHNGTLWAATWDGLDRFDPVTERFTTYKLETDKTPWYLELVEDRKGALWLGSSSLGLQRFDPATGQLTGYQHDMNHPGTLSNNRVNSVHFDQTGTMWVGTQDGLNKFDSTTGTFTVYTKREGLPGNAVGCILEDEHGDLWMSTNNGIARLDPQGNTFKNYSTADGLPGPDLTGWGACFRGAAGEMFFGGFSGATAFFPDKVRDNSYVPPIVLTDFRLFGKNVALDPDSPLKKIINFTDAITLTRTQNIFSIGFSALSYSDPATNRYRYMLEGLDHHWNEVGSDQRLASYTTLPAGTYTFRVQGATSRGAWTEPGAQLRIEILPPWWETVWFRATAGILLVLVALAAYNYRLQQLSKTMSARFDERLAERTRLARELHDTFLQTIQGSKIVVDDALDGPADPARMRHAMEQLSVWLGRATQEGRAALNSLRTSTTERNDLAEAFRRATENDVIPRSMSVNFSVVGDAREMHPIVRDEVYRIGYEAIRNASAHSRASQLDVELRYAQDLTVRVKDNGIGIDPAVVDTGKDGHFGLQGMRERTARIGGKLFLVSSLTNGTEIKLVVPGDIIFQASGSPRQTTLGKIRTFFKRQDPASRFD